MSYASYRFSCRPRERVAPMASIEKDFEYTNESKEVEVVDWSR